VKAAAEFPLLFYKNREAASCLPFTREGYQGDVSAALHRDGDFPLVPGAIA
jgi:hypothetical protein